MTLPKNHVTVGQPEHKGNVFFILVVMKHLEQRTAADWPKPKIQVAVEVPLLLGQPFPFVRL
jgi:hypothetical protein